jgi:hypothetical protein
MIIRRPKIEFRLLWEFERFGTDPTVKYQKGKESSPSESGEDISRSRIWDPVLPRIALTRKNDPMKM